MDDDLAELFSNLLVSDMDMRTQNLCTPAFVKVIEQLSPADARVFKTIFNECAKAETAYFSDTRQKTRHTEFNPE